MDISTINYTSNNAGAEFVNSLKKTGFAVIDNHPVSAHLIEGVYREWQEFFNSENKHSYKYSINLQDGYVGLDDSETAQGEIHPDIKEYYQLYFPWGRYPNSISMRTRELFNQLFDVAQVLLGFIEDEVDAEVLKNLNMPLRESPSESKSLFRVINYPPVRNKDGMWAAPHQDINLITLLPASTLSGLQVQGPDESWHDVGTDFGQIIINTGDMLQECSNYYFKSTTHRVIDDLDREPVNRMSFPLFLHPHSEVRLSNRHTAKSYLEERLRENGMLSTDEQLDF
ncbi:MAG: isopenicillin N synthase family oxygenase [Francisellaceae bacterium]|nr:isopenicillin N synthase family oxygenase [Francisellaceae bacterium]MBT6208174.1 isopenicillin N synthase family oxygenase [Francisellaceae bacterium]MBT6539546.1 isopenicillin N synthase family oxygenase [Francisellaceae bacterium]